MPYANDKGASAQSDQSLYCLLHTTSSSYIRNFKPLLSTCGCASRFVSNLVSNREYRFSRDEVHIILKPEQKTKQKQTNKQTTNTHGRLTFITHFHLSSTSTLHVYCIVVIVTDWNTATNMRWMARHLITFGTLRKETRFYFCPDNSLAICRTFVWFPIIIFIAAVHPSYFPSTWFLHRFSCRRKIRC